VSGTPEVSVVVIGFNDAARLTRAIASIQRQTLRNLEIVVVDDASTDETEAVVSSLAADDPRIRFDRLPRNSGGCSAPRNRGIDLARAPWVMFCDSDDEYERHACKNLLLAAEGHDADVACGAAERVDVRTGRTRRWRPELHEELVVADGLAAFPDLMADTISVNKIYRRDVLLANGIRFPEGLLFEDQLFTLEAFSTARRVVSIPQLVYRWYVDTLGDDLSITQRRRELRNVDDRIEINRRIDAFLADRQLDAVADIKAVKFLRHDLYLYLVSMLEADDETATALMERLRPYVATVPAAAAWQVRPALRVAIYHLLVGDLRGLRAAMRFVSWASVVDRRVSRRDGRQLWDCEHLASGPDAGGVSAAAWLDVTSLHLLDVPFTERRFLHRLVELQVDGGRVVASGTSVDYDGSLASAEHVDLVLGLGSSSVAVRVPGTWITSAGRERSWRAEGVALDELGRPLDVRDWGTLAVRVRVDDWVNTTPVRNTLGSPPDDVLAFPGRTASGGPDALAIAPAENGAVGWRAARRDGFPPAHARWGTRLMAVIRRDIGVPLARRLGSLIPATSTVLFDTGALRPANGDARAISEYLHVNHADIAQAWVHRGRPTRVPPYAEGVEHLSLRHHWLAARCRWRLDDGTSSVVVRPRRGGRNVFALDGVPVHRFGLDDPSVLADRAAAREVRRRAATWTAALSPSAFGAEAVATAFGSHIGVAECGLARMDTALRTIEAGEAARAELRHRLDLQIGRPIVLYCPAPRSPATRSEGRDPVPPLLDLERWADEVGDRAYLLVRPHPSEKFAVSTRLRFAVRDVGDADVAAHYVAACDLFVSDYSSLIGDAALARRPIVLFQPDRDVYVNRRHGLYVDLSSVAPVALAMDDLIGLVRTWLDDPDGWARAHGGAVEAFAARCCGPRDGRSAARAASALLGDPVVPPAEGAS
jgi:CDP-glycerol glycerophosphotransferase